jgi:hypothetical protein
VHTLVRIDTREICNDQNETRTFMTVRNEILLLSRTFEHYRKIAVARFFVSDNGSTGGSKGVFAGSARLPRFSRFGIPVRRD